MTGRATAWYCGHLLSLVLPSTTLAFLWGGPWPAWQALAWTMPIGALMAAERFSPALHLDPPPTPNWPFDLILYAMCLLQALNILGMAVLAAQIQWLTLDQALAGAVNLVAIRILMGTTSCCAAIAPAHELIHRGAPWQRWLGQMLLCTVLYTHFAIVHRQLHHRHVAGRLDPSTARVGESYEAFFRRTVRGQWQAAWHRDPRSTAWVVALQTGLLLAIGLGFGPLALAVFIYQAVVAVRLLEAVNYFQHWGLHGQPWAAWNCTNAVSQFLFLGLPRHADHHRHGRKPYQSLCHREGGPSLWYGYLGMALLVKNRNEHFMKRAAALLKAWSARKTL